MPVRGHEGRGVDTDAADPHEDRGTPRRGGRSAGGRLPSQAPLADEHVVGEWGEDDANGIGEQGGDRQGYDGFASTSIALAPQDGNPITG